MASRYYTLIIVPEKTAPLKKIIIPAWILRGAAVGIIFLVLLAGMMLLDYWYVMSQISENKQLKIDNRKLKQQVQVFQNKMSNVESTMERIKTFATRLKVITNIEDRSSLLQSLNQKLPDASTNLGQPEKKAVAQINSTVTSLTGTQGMSYSDDSTLSQNTVRGLNPQWREDPEDVALKKEYEILDQRISALNEETLYVEQVLQDQYELLADQKSFLAALPTRKPAVGYFTSGFGVRKSPIGGREKMHEGVDIANHPGTIIRTPADGIVTFSSTKPGYGLVVIVDHGYGLETLYAHSRKLLVQVGQKIKRGDAIAQLGNTGRSTGPHLHYEVRVNGIPVDPLDYILEN